MRKYRRGAHLPSGADEVNARQRGLQRGKDRAYPLGRCDDLPPTINGCRDCRACMMQADVAKARCRLGEADTPGPGTSQWSGNEGAQYRNPEAVGFWGARAPGHKSNEAEGVERFALRVITANTTAWGPLKSLLLRTDADVVLAQEHHLPHFCLAEASDWARRHNWHSIFLPAMETTSGGWSAGVAILARPHAALSAPRIGSETVVPSRIVAACIEPPGHRQCLVISAYLQDGEGLSAVNLGHLAAMGTCISMHGPCHPFIAGGDYQVKPEDVAQVGFGDQVGATLIASAAARGTCRSTRSYAELDYFFCPERIGPRHQKGQHC